MAERFSHHHHLNASFSALARDALVRAKDGRPVSARVMPNRDWSMHALPRLASRAAADVHYLRQRGLALPHPQAFTNQAGDVIMSADDIIAGKGGFQKADPME